MTFEGKREWLMNHGEGQIFERSDDHYDDEDQCDDCIVMWYAHTGVNHKGVGVNYEQAVTNLFEFVKDRLYARCLF